MTAIYISTTIVRIIAGIKLFIIGCDGYDPFIVGCHLNRNFHLWFDLQLMDLSHTQPPTHSHKIQMGYTARLDRLLTGIGSSSGECVLANLVIEPRCSQWMNRSYSWNVILIPTHYIHLGCISGGR